MKTEMSLYYMAAEKHKSSLDLRTAFMPLCAEQAVKVLSRLLIFDQQ